MKKQFNREDRLMKNLLDEAGVEKPSVNFRDRIMKTVEARGAEIQPYKPLISARGWWSVAAFSIIIFSGLLSLYSGISFSGMLSLEILHFPDFPKIDLSRTMQYAIAFIALFFLEVPFLKRFLDREYRL
ncbi:hypothetical protein [Christiangramia sabulilitoris]|uniref:Uncharacterized protein n=1 Tax=Christiangramia sabulilitoris TaxID=2583991 RepID=A0A550HYY4_9FLAO|nr:hypothetical protein [Christiangramia sabulilitoris]TRO63944.1 hypothetical protein FGM01_10560 [Christiangramia sabulilitoris]